MTNATNASHRTSINLAFELLVEEDGEKQQAKLHEVTTDYGVGRGYWTTSRALSVAPASQLSMSAGEVLEELLGKLYVDHRKLKFLEVIGEGGFASVHKCELQVVLNFSTSVAVKQLKPGAFQGVSELKEFLLEANVLRKMHHPHIVELIGVGAADLTDLTSARASMFLVQEYMGGGDLKQLLVRNMAQPFEPLYTKQDALRWGMHIAEALYYLHTVCRPTIIHRDLKLENILLTDGPMHQAQAKLADFGLHKRLGRGGAFLAQKPISTETDLDRSYYGGAAYYRAVLEHDRALIGSAAPDVSLGQIARVPSAASQAALSATSARLLALIMSDGTEPMDDLSVHRKRRALQMLEQSDASDDGSLVFRQSPEPSLHHLAPSRSPRPFPPPTLPPILQPPPGPAASDPPRMSRSASHGNLLPKRVTFMDSIAERHNSDSSMHRPSVDLHPSIQEGYPLLGEGAATRPSLLATSGMPKGILHRTEPGSANGVPSDLRESASVSGQELRSSWPPAGAGAGTAGGGGEVAGRAGVASNQDSVRSAEHNGYELLRTDGTFPGSPDSHTDSSRLFSGSSVACPASPNMVSGSPDACIALYDVRRGSGREAGAGPGKNTSGRPTAEWWGDSGKKPGSGKFHKGASGSMVMDATQKVGSLLYMAPEMTLGQPYNEKVDVFAFGVLLYELFMGQSLLVRLAVRMEGQNTKSEEFMMQYAESVAEGFREEIPEWWPHELRRLVADCWHPHPSSRPSFALILQRLHELHAHQIVAHMDIQKKKGYNPAIDCGCSIM